MSSIVCIGLIKMAYQNFGPRESAYSKISGVICENFMKSVYPRENWTIVKISDGAKNIYKKIGQKSKSPMELKTFMRKLDKNQIFDGAEILL